MPLPIVTIDQMRQWEEASWAAGRSPSAVIRRVGELLAARVLAFTVPGEPVLILAGRGHNGDDARCAEPHLAGRRVTVLEVTDPETALPAVRCALAQGARASCVIDGLFGIGLNRPLARPWHELIDALQSARPRVVAVDVPSGLNADTGRPMGAALRADLTLTLGAPKRGLLQAAAWEFTGRLEVAPEIGLVACPCESDTQWTLAADFAGYPPPRPVAAHKGGFGHLAIVAGSVGYHGAAVLAARGAQRARPGLITLLTQAGCYAPVAAQLQSAMVHPWSEAWRVSDSTTALLLGPGLAGTDVPEGLRAQVAVWWRTWPGAVVADASALDWLPAGPVAAGALRAMTPHPGEAARLLGRTSAAVQDDRPGALRELSARFGGCWVVLKGHQTLIGTCVGALHVNSSGNPGLAQGGSGDLLAGFLAGLWAQRAWVADPGPALRYGVWQHGAAADRLEAASPHWTIEELAAALGGAPVASFAAPDAEAEARGIVLPSR